MTTIYGTSDSDRLQGSSAGDRLKGDGGDDWLIGGLGSDSIYGGDGEDILYADDDLADRKVEYEPPIEITESDLTIEKPLIFLNLLDGGNGDDLLVGSYANDIEDGGNGDDLLLGYGGKDLLRGENGKDVLNGHGGDDTLLGGDDNDILRGNSGNDLLNGGNGRDYLRGWNDFDSPCSSNIDNFIGGSGRDTFILGSSYETFYQVGKDKDLAIIEDFQPRKDTIRLNGDIEDYSLQVDTMVIGDEMVMGTYINYDVYEEGEKICFVVNKTDINLESNYVEFL